MDMLGTSRCSVNVAGTRTGGFCMRVVQLVHTASVMASMRDPKF